MEVEWYYHDSAERRGPMPFSSLIAALAGQPDPRQVPVWRQGMPDWTPAGSVPEVAGELPQPVPRLPPPQRPLPPARPFASPTASARVQSAVPSAAAPHRPAPTSSDFLSQAEAIASTYRRLVLTVGAQLLLGFLRFPVFGALALIDSGPLIVVAIIAYFVAFITTSVMIATTAYKLSGHLEAGPPLAWAVVMFVPCVNILFLLILSAKSQTWCRQYGIAVGFLGPSRESIEEIRRRSAGADFE